MWLVVYMACGLFFSDLQMARYSPLLSTDLSFHSPEIAISLNLLVGGTAFGFVHAQGCLSWCNTLNGQKYVDIFTSHPYELA